jgi:hypothetical protein
MGFRFDARAPRGLAAPPRGSGPPPQHRKNSQKRPPERVGRLVCDDGEYDADEDTDQRHEVPHTQGHLLPFCVGPLYTILGRPDGRRDLHRWAEGAWSYPRSDMSIASIPKPPGPPPRPKPPAPPPPRSSAFEGPEMERDSLKLQFSTRS